MPNEASTRTIVIARRWDNTPTEEVARLQLALDDTHLCVEIGARYESGGHPDSPPGDTWKLWEHDVVELFLLGPDGHYIELEFGPHGHTLALELEGVRQITKRLGAFEYKTVIENACWKGSARIPLGWLPGIERYNAYAILGTGAGERRFFAHRGAAGEAPDFHRLETFVAW